MILHLSDLHFGTEREACLQAIRQLCEEHPFEAVVVSDHPFHGSHLRLCTCILHTHGVFRVQYIGYCH